MKKYKFSENQDLNKSKTSKTHSNIVCKTYENNIISFFFIKFKPNKYINDLLQYISYHLLT